MADVRPTIGAAGAAPTHRGILLGTVTTFVSMTALTVTFPFAATRRDELGCDALCQGSQTSLRSLLTLIGASLIGRASDRVGRVPMLWLGLVGSFASIMINMRMDSLQGMWYSIVPSALLNQSFSVTKALFSDYIDERGGADAGVRAGAVGKLGMAVGISFMAGPLLATALVSSYVQALQLSAAMSAGSGLLLCMLPTPTAVPRPAAAGGGGLLAFLRLPVLRTPGALLLGSVRLLMALAFHMYAPIWQVSLKARFAFGPSDHARFMGLVGLAYALSQGVISKPLVAWAGKDPSKLILGCVLLLGGLRPFALWTSSVLVVYALYIPMVLSLGVMNTAITTVCSRLAEADQLGGLFGVLESVESVAGMVGPAAGGLLSRYHEHATLTAVLGAYALAFALVAGCGQLLGGQRAAATKKED